MGIMKPVEQNDVAGIEAYLDRGGRLSAGRMIYNRRAVTRLKVEDSGYRIWSGARSIYAPAGRYGSLHYVDIRADA